MGSIRLAISVLLLALPALPVYAAKGPSAPDIESALHRIAQGRNAWPGFDPLKIPLAVYDGSRTYLFRHPSPGSAFAHVDASTYVMNGRHEAVNSNTSAEIGGVMTATLMADGERGEQAADELAAVAMHESFHVYQRAHHKGWSGNEGDLLLYPADNARLLSLRRQETEALRRALATRSKTDSACWTRVALDARHRRFAAMDSAFSRYERLTELNEGLASYLQLYALYRPVEFPDGEFAPAAVRHRTYTVGPALAYLLDRFRPDWKEFLEKNDAQYLDQMLATAVINTDATVACAFPEDDVARFEERAKEDAGAVAAGRKTLRAAFDAYSGWRIVIETDAQHPLWPNGFDPLNVQIVDGGLLHTRFASLKNDDGHLEALDGEGADIAVLTAGPGPHPLFNGVTRAVVNVPGKPEVNIRGEHRVDVRAPGVSVKAGYATIHEREREVRIRLGK